MELFRNAKEKLKADVLAEFEGVCQGCLLAFLNHNPKGVCGRCDRRFDEMGMEVFGKIGLDFTNPDHLKAVVAHDPKLSALLDQILRDQS